MLKKICNYLTVMALLLTIGGGSILANPVSTEKAKIKTVAVDESKDFSLFNGVLESGGQHKFTVKVESGKEVRMVLHAQKGVSLKIRTADGQTQTFAAEKFFEVKLRAAGEYTIELDSLYVSQYSLEVFNR